MAATTPLTGAGRGLEPEGWPMKLTQSTRVTSKTHAEWPPS